MVDKENRNNSGVFCIGYGGSLNGLLSMKMIESYVMDI